MSTSSTTSTSLEPQRIVIAGGRTYRRGERIGKGTFCEVFEASDDHDSRESQSRFVIKTFNNARQFRRTIESQMRVKRAANCEGKKHIERIVAESGGELAIGSTIRLAPTKTSESSRTRAHAHTPISILPFVIMPRYELRLKDYVRAHIEKNGVGLPAVATLVLARQMFCALECLERAQIVHSDVKPGNIMIRGEPIFDLDRVTHFETVLCDFGSSHHANLKKCKPASVGTLPYIAPEILIGKSYGYGADVWSMMLTIFFVITGCTLFDIYDDDALEYEIDVSGIFVESDDESEKSSASASSSTSTSTSASTASKGDSSLFRGTSTTSSEGEESDVSSDIDFATMYAHVTLFYYILGKPPEAFCEELSNFYHNGAPRYHTDMPIRSISEFFLNNFSGMTLQEMRDIQEFLLLGLRYLDSDRQSASEILEHSFISKQQEDRDDEADSAAPACTTEEFADSQRTPFVVSAPKRKKGKKSTPARANAAHPASVVVAAAAAQAPKKKRCT